MTNAFDPSTATPEELAAAREQFEAEKLTRRSALRKFGITSGMAVFGMFASDDLARMVIQKMEEHKETRQIAETVAYEFKNSGIAFADSSNQPACGYYNFPGCWNCCHAYNVKMNALNANMDNCRQQGHTYDYCNNLYNWSTNTDKYGNDLNTCSDNCSEAPCMCSCTSA